MGAQEWDEWIARTSTPSGDGRWPVTVKQVNAATGFSTNPTAEEANIEIAKMLRDLGMENVNLGKATLAKQEALAEEQLGLARQVTEDQLSTSATMRERSDSLWNQYQTMYKPIEERVAQEAMDYDSPERMSQMAERARADVRSASTAGMDMGRREAMRYGVNPNSGKFIDANSKAYRDAGLMEANAMNSAREGVRDRAIALRAGAAATGRGLPNAAAQQSGQSVNAGSSATDTMNRTAQTTSAMTGTGPQWSQMGLSTLSGAGGQFGNLYGIQQGVRNADRMADANESAGMWSALGGAAGLGAVLAWTSSEDVKEDKEPVNADLILDGLENIPVEAWKYKNGVADGARHVGPYAEDVNAQFGDGAAPGGEVLDPITMNGIALAGIQALAKKVKKLEKSMGLEAAVPMKRKMRDTEPRRVA